MLNLFFMFPPTTYTLQKGNSIINSDVISICFDATGTNLAIGMPAKGMVQVYRHVSGAWEQIGNDIYGISVGDQFGWSVSLNGNGTILAIGSPYYNNGNGKVNVYRLKNYDTAWVADNITLSDTTSNVQNKRFGHSVSLNYDGDNLCIGSPGSYNTLGQIFDYYYGQPANGAMIWSWWRKSTAVLVGEETGGLSANFGYSISLDQTSNILAAGAPSWSNAKGYVKIFKWNNAQYYPTPDVTGSIINGNNNGDRCGHSISLKSYNNTNILAIGIPGSDTGRLDGGCVRIYKQATSTSQWVQMGNDILAMNMGESLGYSVSLNEIGTRVAIGVVKAPGGGCVRIYDWDGTDWKMVSDINGSTSNDGLGYAVTLNKAGDTLCVGASGTDIKIYNLV